MLIVMAGEGGGHEEDDDHHPPHHEAWYIMIMSTQTYISGASGENVKSSSPNVASSFCHSAGISDKNNEDDKDDDDDNADVDDDNYNYDDGDGGDDDDQVMVPGEWGEEACGLPIQQVLSYHRKCHHRCCHHHKCLIIISMGNIPIHSCHRCHHYQRCHPQKYQK